jgi:DNA-binding NarL/FixJ family response regulator
LSAYTVILADDHVMFRKGVKKIISEFADLKVIGEADDGLELLQLLNHKTPDLVIVDISMPNLRGLEATREIKKLHPQIKIMLLTMHRKREFLKQAIDAGAEGFLLKEDADSELIQGIKAIREGKKFISPLLAAEMTDLIMRKDRVDLLSTREREVLKLFAEGKTPKEISDLLFISILTVRRHLANIKKKTNLKKSQDLVRFALSEGYINDRP